MNELSSISPVRFDPSMEKLEPEEAATSRALDETLLKISETTFKDSGRATRSVHAKSHGVLRGELTVYRDLAPILAQGLFAKPGQFPLVMRLSTIPGDILDDNVSTPRGLAIKVMGIQGDKSPDDGRGEQDFVLVNAPAFAAPSAKKFLGSLKMLAATTDKAEGMKKGLSKLARGTEALLEAFGAKSATVVTMGGHPETHILGETFYSQAPILFGPYIAKICVAPVAPSLLALTNAHVDLKNHPDGLREAVREYFVRTAGEWEIRAQLCTDVKAMPIEDSSVAWPEDRSPYIPVGRIVAPVQDSWNDAAVTAIDEGTSFSPWRCLSAHRPLGSVMRARKSAYESSARFRSVHNGCPISLPK
jgi:Catalase